MGFWAGIKHALNSTLGTEDFIPLDKLIKGQRTLAASDVSVAVISGSTSSALAIGYEFPKRFIARAKGVVRVIAKGVPQNASGDYGYIDIYSDGTKVETITIKTREEVSADVSVGKGQELSFQVRGSKVNFDYVRIGAQIVDGSLFEVNSVS